MMTLPPASVTSVEKILDQAWLRPDRRAENPGIRKEEDELRLGSWIQKKVNGTRRNKVKQFSAPGSETPSIPLKNPKRVWAKEKAKGIKRQSGA